MDLVPPLLLLACGARASAEAGAWPGHDRCEPISMPLCRDMPYNSTQFPNLLGQHSQEEAGLQAHHFFPLVKYNCSAALPWFLCSVFAPACTAHARPLPPCRDTCEAARRGCEAQISAFGFAWPQSLACERFPAAAEDAACVGDGAAPDAATTPAPRRDVAGMAFQCPVYFQTPAGLDYALRVGPALVADCGAPCDGMFYGAEESALSRALLGAAAALCLAPTLLCVATFLLDTARFPYPERPIVYMSGCYACVSLCYVLGWCFGAAAACDAPHAPPRHLSAALMISAITQRSGTLCTLLFMLRYGATLAAGVWWLLLTLTWFLMAGLKWSHEAVARLAAAFHAAAWAAPALATIGLVGARRVQGDVLTGTCFVGLWDSQALLWFVLAPQLASLALGLLLLLAGFCSVARMRAALPAAQTERMRSFAARIALFSALYCAPAALAVATLAWHWWHHDAWMLAWQRDKCELRSEPWLAYGISCPPGKHHPRPPPLAFFLLAHLSSLLIGFIAGCWVCSGKTLALWRSACCSKLSRKASSHV